MTTVVGDGPDHPSGVDALASGPFRGGVMTRLGSPTRP